MKLKQWIWKDDERVGSSLKNRYDTGVIAQDVEKVLPMLVEGTDTKTVDYHGLIGLLIEAVKEQQAQIEGLKGRLA